MPLLNEVAPERYCTSQSRLQSYAARCASCDMNGLLFVSVNGACVMSADSKPLTWNKKFPQFLSPGGNRSIFCSQCCWKSTNDHTLHVHVGQDGYRRGRSLNVTLCTFCSLETRDMRRWFKSIVLLLKSLVQ